MPELKSLCDLHPYYGSINSSFPADQKALQPEKMELALSRLTGLLSESITRTKEEMRPFLPGYRMLLRHSPPNLHAAFMMTGQARSSIDTCLHRDRQASSLSVDELSST